MANLIQMLNGFKADNAAKAEAIINAIATANNGLMPTKDTNGRLHAPCNGYTYNGSVWGAGEYLSDELTRSENGYKAKVKVLTTLQSDIKAVWSFVSFGKSWTDNNGNSVCYAYFDELTKAQADKLNSALSSNKKRMMLASDAQAQGLQHGKVFKFNARKYAYALLQRFECLEYALDQDGIADSDWDIKGGKFECVFKGKDVCFVYGSNKDYFSE